MLLSGLLTSQMGLLGPREGTGLVQVHTLDSWQSRIQLKVSVLFTAPFTHSAKIN